MEVEEKGSWPVVYLFGFDTVLRLDLQSLHSEWKMNRCSTQTQSKWQMSRCSTQKRRKKVSQLRLQSSLKKRPLYRWVLVKTALEIPRVTLYPAAEFVGKWLDKRDYWLKTCSFIIGEHIYLFGISYSHSYVDLVKHNINHPRPSSWKTVFSIVDFIPVGHVIFAPVSRKLYVFKDYKFYCKIYDLDRNTWEDAKSPQRGRNPAHPYFCKSSRFEPLLVEDETEVLFYSLENGCLIYFSLTNHEVRVDTGHPSLALTRRFYGDFVPAGLEEAASDSDQAIDNLARIATRVHPLLSSSTLYWFTRDLHMYGYDIKLKRWVRSPYLGNQMPTLTDLDCSHNPFLVDLRNGKFLAVVPEGIGEFTVALLTVVRNENSLSVTVESFHPLSDGAASFLPCAGIAVSAKG